MDRNRKFFIIKETIYSNIPNSFEIELNKKFDFETAIRKLFALDELNDNRNVVKYHLQEVTSIETDKVYEETKEEVNGLAKIK
jgi:hypothetical protein|tara:strand:+ start:119 stop:367 length:249 start_codon:yes stop_codon:yes gene_type:complete